MSWEPIIKSAPRGGVAPNLRNYEQARAAFSWEEARSELDGLPGGGCLNIAHEAVDRHAASALRDKTAIKWLGKDGSIKDFSFAQLRDLTNRFANALGKLGVGRGDRVYALMGRVPELYATALGALKNRSVFCPLFSAFGPEPIKARVNIGGAKVLVTTESLYQRKVAKIRDELPSLEHVLLVGETGANTPGALDFNQLMGEASDQFTIGPTDPEDVALLHFTSGTTGAPKGAVHVHGAVVAHHITGKLALDLHRDDIFWCTADPGWVTGTSYGIIAPLTNGVTMIVEGRDVSLITYGGSLGKTLEAAETLAKEGVEAEVIDLRVLRPLGARTILASVAKTHRAVIIDEAWRTGSFAAEISAQIMENAFDELDAPVARVCSEEAPMPYAKHLEDAALPQADKIVKAVREMM